MITAEHEGGRGGTGPKFADVVALDFCDAEHELFGLVWMTRTPTADRTRADAMVFARGELVEDLAFEREGTIDGWDHALVEGIRMSTSTPLERWSVTVRGEKSSLEFEVEGLTGPRELTSEELKETTGIELYEQLCRLSGAVDLGGRTYPVRCLGRRVHSWGDFAWSSIERWRTFYLVSAHGQAFSVSGALPAGTDGHEAELRSVRALDADDPPPYDDVRVSTVFDGDGLPAKVGLELWEQGNDLPRRLGGEAVCGARTRRADHDLVVSFCRWSIDGEPAYGCYELARRA